MPGYGVIITTLLLFSVTEFALSSSVETVADTSLINSQTREAMKGARSNPDKSIATAYHTLTLSKQSVYERGIADASLALGNSYLWKYNTDSAKAYCRKSFDIYQRLGDSYGMARACHTLSYVYSFAGGLTESEHYATLSLGYYDKAGDLRGMTSAYNALSYIASARKEFDKARSLSIKAIETAKQSKDTLLLAEATNSLGNIYTEMTLFAHAADTYFEALRLWEAKKDSGGLSLAFGNIGLVYFYQKDYRKAMEYYLKKLPVSESVKNLWELGKTYNNIAQVYNATQKYDSSLLFLRKYLLVYRKMNYTPGIIEASDNMASCMLMLSKIDSSFWYIKNAVTLATEIKDPALPRYYVTLANVYRAMGNTDLALKYANEAYNKGKEKNLPLVISAASGLLSDLWHDVNNNTLAYKYLKDYYQLKDSISNSDFLNQVTRLEMEYEFDKKQKAMEYASMQETIIRDNKIKQQRTYLKGLIALLFLVAVFSILLLRHNQLRARYSRIDLEQRLLRAQMNPHFIFNSLCAVQDLILADKPQKANIFLTKIARLMRNILENSREEYIALGKEIETLSLYLEVQQLRFETGFDYQISIDEAIDTENISVPPMLAQPCVENSIEHGLLPSREKGNIKIAYKLQDGMMMLEVTDNGVGREKAALQQKSKIKKTSLSTHLNEKRLQHFRKTLKEKRISYEISDLKEGDKATGTKVKMILPCKKIYA